MPRGTPSIKVHNVQRLGAVAVLHGDDFDEAKFRVRPACPFARRGLRAAIRPPARHRGPGDRGGRDPAADP
jgi:hypothetical protein